MVQGKINRGRHTDHPAGRHSLQTKQCPSPPSPYFYRPDALPAAQPTVSKHRRQHLVIYHSEQNCILVVRTVTDNARNTRYLYTVLADSGNGNEVAGHGREWESYYYRTPVVGMRTIRQIGSTTSQSCSTCVAGQLQHPHASDSLLFFASFKPVLLTAARRLQ